LRTFAIRLPPLPEQHRIAAKIEELLTKLDAGVEGLKKVKAQLKVYRQAVLKHAFEGKLTEEWREANREDLEPVSVLLERIRKRRNQSSQRAERLIPVDRTKLSSLPDLWNWVRTGDVCVGIVPGRTRPQEFKGDIPWITLPDVRGLYVSTSQEQLAVTKEGAEKVGMKVMQQGTVLMSCVGRFGIVCIAKNAVVPNQQFHGFVCDKDVLPEYLAYSLMIQTEQMERLSTATTIAYLNRTKCNSITIPLSPTLEQRRIVEEIERCFSVADAIEKGVEQSLKQAERLRQSILKRAF